MPVSGLMAASFPDTLAEKLIKGKFSDALELYRNSTEAVKYPALKTPLLKLADLPGEVAKSFIPGIGSQQIVKTKYGPKPLIIGKVKGPVLFIKVKIGKAIVYKKMHVKLLAPEEINKRLKSSLSPLAMNLYLGANALRHNDIIQARKYFQKSGVLQKELTAQLNAVESARIDALAETAYRKLEKSLGGKISSVTSISLLKFSQEKCLKLKEELGEYLREFGKSKFTESRHDKLENLSKLLTERLEIRKADNLNYSSDLAAFGITDFYPVYLKLSQNPPDQDWKVPVNNSESIRYGILKLGPGKRDRINLAVVNSDGKIWLFYAFGDKPAFSRQKSFLNSRHLPVETAIDNGSRAKYKYAVTFHYDPDKPEKIIYYRTCIQHGRIPFDGKNRKIVLIDNNSDGNYSDLKNTTLLLDLDQDGEFSKGESFSADKFFKTGSGFYRVESIAPSGRHIKINKAPLVEITGRIKNYLNSKPVGGARVKLPGLMMSSVTGNDGLFRFKLPAGNYEMLVFASGFETERKLLLRVNPDKLKAPDLYLKPVKK